MIKFRIDVDYPYPSRIRSMIYTALNMRISKDYLKNSKTIARMINDSPIEVKAYWFFTTKTLPDPNLITLLDPQKHEIALHLINHPFKEKKILETTTRRPINYFTIHGTARLIMRVLWKRWKSNTPIIPKNFPLKSFHHFPTLSVDVLCFSCNRSKTLEKTKESISKGKILEIHPDWLFQKGTFNHRGPYYSILRTILKVDQEFENLVQNKRLFAKIGHLSKEYEKNIDLTDQLLNKLKEHDLDIFTFIERSWCQNFSKIPKNWIKTEDNIALLNLETYEDWWKKIGKKTRNMVRKAKKNGLFNKIIQPNEKFVEGIWKIYNETPIRQGRRFLHYGVILQTVKRRVLSSKNSTFIGAYLKEELVGFIQLVHGDNVAIISQILSLQKHWNKAINNALLAKAIEFCANQQVKWLMYGRMGNHPSLDRFKQNNGFTRFSLARYYVPLTVKGKIATKLGLHREFKDILPQSLKYTLIPVTNWISRTKTKVKQQNPA